MLAWPADRSGAVDEPSDQAGAADRQDPCVTADGDDPEALLGTPTRTGKVGNQNSERTSGSCRNAEEVFKGVFELGTLVRASE